MGSLFLLAFLLYVFKMRAQAGLAKSYEGYKNEE